MKFLKLKEKQKLLSIKQINLKKNIKGSKMK